jgi:hypothetical protein
MSETSIPFDPEETNILHLQDVTSIEAFALASAVITYVAGGNKEIVDAITTLANNIFCEIMGIETPNAPNPDSGIIVPEQTLIIPK